MTNGNIIPVSCFLLFVGRFKRNHATLEVPHAEWRQFIRWAKSTGFDLVFAVNNEDKMSSGMWDPNMALNILTVAEKANVGEIFWQLGYGKLPIHLFRST